MKKATERPDYEKLMVGTLHNHTHTHTQYTHTHSTLKLMALFSFAGQEYEFFKKYFTAEVAVATWLKNIGIIE